MPGTEIQDLRNFDDVVQLLELHPEWLVRLRPILFTKDLLALPEQITRLTEQMGALVEAQRRTEQQVASLALSVQALTDDMGRVKGKRLETHYHVYGSSFFGALLRRPQVLSIGDLTDLLDDALDQGTFTIADVREIQRADVVVRGLRREDGATMYLIVEVSWTVDIADVERTARRTASLAKTGLPVLPVVAGEVVRPSAAELAQKLRVWQVTDSDVIAPAP